jgi:hypothetical protein
MKEYFQVATSVRASFFTRHSKNNAMLKFRAFHNTPFTNAA